jgi:hypothetical protein
MKKLFFFFCVVLMTSASLSAQETFYLNDDAIDVLKTEMMELRESAILPLTGNQAQPNGQAFTDAVILEAKVVSIQTLMDLIQSGSDNNQAAINAVFENPWFDRPELTPAIIADTKIYLKDLTTK